MVEINPELNWKLSKDGAGFKCEMPGGLRITIYPLARDRYLEWSWIAFYDVEKFKADHGTCIGRMTAIKEALKALKKRGVDVNKLPCDGGGIPV